MHDNHFWRKNARRKLWIFKVRFSPPYQTHIKADCPGFPSNALTMSLAA
jgi:hypothetical protein